MSNYLLSVDFALVCLAFQENNFTYFGVLKLVYTRSLVEKFLDGSLLWSWLTCYKVMIWIESIFWNLGQFLSFIILNSLCGIAYGFSRLCWILCYSYCLFVRNHFLSMSKPLQQRHNVFYVNNIDKNQNSIKYLDVCWAFSATQKH